MKEPNGLKLSRESGNTTQLIQPRASATTGLWVTVAALALALAGLTGYGFVVLDEYGIEIRRLPGLEGTLTKLGLRAESTETTLARWETRADQLEANLKKVNARIRHHRKIAERRADRAVAALEERIGQRFTEQATAVNARFGEMETEQAADRAITVQLGTGLNSLRQETQWELAGLERSQALQRRELGALAAQRERRRVDFELAKGRTVEIAPGVSLHVEKTDVSFQRVKGWIWLLPDARAVWVRELGAQQPLVFYSKVSDEPRELVITRVGRKTVTGYLVLPASDDVLSASAPEPQPSDTGASAVSGL